MPTIFRVGMAMDLLNIAGNRVLVSGEFQHPPDNAERASFGAEYGLGGYAFVRGGYYFRYDMERFGLGGGVHIPTGTGVSASRPTTATPRTTTSRRSIGSASTSRSSAPVPRGPGPEAAMRVYISADIEGVSGVATWDQARTDGPDHPRARVWMTEDVNAAVAGAVEAGATRGRRPRRARPRAEHPLGGPPPGRPPDQRLGSPHRHVDGTRRFLRSRDAGRVSPGARARRAGSFRTPSRAGSARCG